MERSTTTGHNTRIALVGSNHTAKLAVGRWLEKQYNWSFLSVQDPIRRIMKQLYTYGHKETINWEKRYKIYDAIYDIDHTTWVGYLERRLTTITRDVVVPDCRFLDEIQYLRKIGFIIVRINSKRIRKFPPPSQTMTKVPGKISLSEYYSRGFDEILGVEYSINQDDTISLRKATDELVVKLHERKTPII